MDRRTTCLARAAMCRERAAQDDTYRAYWMSEAARWDAHADEAVDDVGFERGGRSPKSES